MSDLEPQASGLPDTVLALSVLLSGVVGAGISSLAVNERMRDIYQSMGVELPGLLKLALEVNAPWVCGGGGAFAALLVYLVISGRISTPLHAKLARSGATLTACLLVLFAVAAREGMQQGVEGLRLALSQGGPELPPPVPGEAQALAREVVQGVERGLKSSKDGEWEFRGPGQALVRLSLPGGTDPEREAAVRFPSAGSGEQVQAAPSASGAELSYAFELRLARVEESSQGSGHPQDGRLYLLNVLVFRGPADPGAPLEQFQAVLR